MSIKISFDQAGKVKISTDAGAARRAKAANVVQDKTFDQLDAWIDANLTGLASVKPVVKELVKAVYTLNTDVLRLKQEIAAIKEEKHRG